MKEQRYRVPFGNWLAMLLLVVSGCAGTTGDDRDGRSSTNGVIRLAVTTSTQDSGLLNQLLPPFEKAHQIRVDVIAVGTGKCLRLGERGEVDAILVHSRPDEDKFMEAGHGVRRDDLMHNTFEILGPSSDPAAIRGMDPVDALQRIAETRNYFVSRGDESGTHKKENGLWQSGGGRPSWSSYLETGQGQGPTLVIASEKQAYVLSDRGTFLAMRSKLSLSTLVRGSDILQNPYGYIVVDPEKNPSINASAANALGDYLKSDQAQEIISNFRVDGEALFYPTRIGQ